MSRKKSMPQKFSIDSFPATEVLALRVFTAEVRGQLTPEKVQNPFNDLCNFCAMLTPQSQETNREANRLHIEPLSTTLCVILNTSSTKKDWVEIDAMWNPYPLLLLPTRLYNL